MTGDNDDTVVEDETVTDAAKRRQSERADHVRSMIGDEAAAMLDDRTYPTTSEELAQEYAIESIDLPNETEDLGSVFDRLKDEEYTTPEEAQEALASALEEPTANSRDRQTSGDVYEDEPTRADTEADLPETASKVVREDFDPNDELVEPTLEHETVESTEEMATEHERPTFDAEKTEPPTENGVSKPPLNKEVKEAYRGEAAEPIEEETESPEDETADETDDES